MSISVETPTPYPGTQPARVLIVDDEVLVRTVMRMMLQHSGFMTEEVGTAADALARVRSAAMPFTAVLLDYTLPDRLGTDMVPELRQLSPHLRIVLTSGRTEEELRGHGADGYLPKPFTREQIVAAVYPTAATSK